MPTLPGHHPIEPDTPNPKDPIHHPHKPDHPFHDEREEEGIETDDDEDTGSNPWWMRAATAPGRKLPAEVSRHGFSSHE